MKTLFLESVAGVAGDMFSAAFLDAGLVEPDAIQAVPTLLGLTDVEITVSHRTTASIQATHLAVSAGPESDHHVVLGSSGHHDHHGHTAYRDVDRVLSESDLEPDAKDFAREVFRHLAEAEAGAHGMAVEDVHFHEVGSIDSVVDVAMAGVCVSAVAADRVLATPVKLGRGTIRIQHGVHAVPPPASARLAKEFQIASVPSAITLSDVELSTPTGLAILKTLSPRFVDAWPDGVVLAQGAGCGTIDLGSYPNIFRVVVLESGSQSTVRDSLSDAYASDQVVEICYNVDDDSGERIAWVADQLRSMGALDVWLSQVIGKKGRPTVIISLLAEPGRAASFADWILRHTSTFGVRYRTWDRVKLERADEVRDVGGNKVTFKIGRNRGGDLSKEKAEYEDLRRVWENDPDFRA